MPSLKKFLTLRAQGVPDRRLFQIRAGVDGLEGHADRSRDRAVRDLHRHALRPEDRVRGLRHAAQSEESAALDKYKSQLRGMEDNLPVEARYKNFERGFKSPIAVADQVHGGGDNMHGVQTIAFNLPNDEKVREAKGAKKVILRNVLGAKYERILKPMAGLVLVPDQAAQVTKKYMSSKPCSTSCRTASGRDRSPSSAAQTTVDKELKDIGGGFEEAKADVMGA